MVENVCIWHYSLDNGPNQYTVFDTIYEDMRYLRDIGADGIFTQYEHCELGFRRFEHQITNEMFWNPDMTREEYADRIDNMLRRYYGDGWEFIREYISYLEKAQDLVGCWHCWEWQSAGMNHPKYDTSYYSTHFDDFLRMIDEAMYRANSTEQELRAERLKCHILYMGCYSSYFTEHLRGRTERIEVLEERWAEFRSLMTKNGLSSSWIPTISPSFGGFGVQATLHDTAWKCWLPWYEDLCGKIPPENIPE